MRIYMEIDGVINAPKSPSLWGAPTFDSINYGGYIFVWSTAAVEALVKLCERSDTEIVWVSGWNESIEVLSRLLGFGHIGADASAVEGIGVRSTPYEKADAILLDLEENPLGAGERWVWLDPSSDDVMQDEGYVYRMLSSDGFVPPIATGLGVTPSLMQHLINVSGEETSNRKNKGNKGNNTNKREGGK